MNNLKEFKLIDGEFTPTDSRDVLINLLEFKIQYHKRKIFGHEERFGTKNVSSEKRLAELIETRNEIMEFMENIDSDLKIQSTITIHSKKSVEVAH